MSRQQEIESIATHCGVKAETGRSMAEFTTIGVGGPVEVLLRPVDIEAMGSLLRELRDAGFSPRLLGGGANLVAGPGPFTDPVVLTRGIRHGPLFEGNRVRAGCGMVVKRLVGKCVDQGLGGLEFAEGIPGTVGGTVFMNAGSYGGQMSDVVREVALFTPDGELHRRSLSPGDFAYRKSPFSKDDALVEAVFELTPSDPVALRERLKKIAGQRLGSQPPGERSAGCIFRNPDGDSAGRLVDSLGLKGMSIGGASVSKIHGNFIVNRGDATPEDVIALIDRVRKAVKDKSGITLQREVIFWE